MNTNEQAIKALEQSNQMLDLAKEQLKNLDLSNQMELCYAIISQTTTNLMAIQMLKLHEILSK